jgi:hypothetical protein
VLGCGRVDGKDCKVQKVHGRDNSYMRWLSERRVSHVAIA